MVPVLENVSTEYVFGGWRCVAVGMVEVSCSSTHCGCSSRLKINQSFNIQGKVSYNNHIRPQTVLLMHVSLVLLTRQPYRDFNKPISLFRETATSQNICISHELMNYSIFSSISFSLSWCPLLTSQAFVLCELWFSFIL